MRGSAAGLVLGLVLLAARGASPSVELAPEADVYTALPEECWTRR